MTKKFKVLLVYPNGFMLNPPPISYGIFTALLKSEGYEVALFDTTLYRKSVEAGGSSDDKKEATLQVRPFSYESRGVQYIDGDPKLDFRQKILEFKPDLVCISVLETVYDEVLPLFEVLNDFREVKVLAGSVFATYAPKIVLEHECVDYICQGEGETTLIEVCKRLESGRPVDDVPNLSFLRNGELQTNPKGPLVDLDELPIPDYSLFEYSRFLRPMGGKVYVTVPIETNRGCPYACAFCNSPANNIIYKQENQTFFRKKTIATLENEIQTLISRHDAEYIYFTSDTFMLFTDKEWEEFKEMYKEISLPFWMQTRAETLVMKPERVAELKELGCHRVSMGLEHGNEEFRKKVIVKAFSNEYMVEASRLLAEQQIPLTINNIIGFPGETRELVFDTIEINRKLIGIGTTNVAVFAPFHGTPLRDVCIRNGYIAEDHYCGKPNTTTSLKSIAGISPEELEGLRRTFALYTRMPTEYWDDIRRAEISDEEGDKQFFRLATKYRELFFDSGGLGESSVD